MTVITEIGFKPLKGDFRSIDLLHPERINRRRFETTLITGRNGSNKSALLKHLVQCLAAPMTAGEDGQLSLNPNRDQVLCISGSVADRFPERELSNGTRTPFDVPNYTYVGQRVGSNLLSKRAPLEAMLGFALAAGRRERFSWNFFREAHAHAGIRPSVRYTLHTRTDLRGTRTDLIGVLQGKSTEASNKNEKRDAGKPVPRVSRTMAEWLLDEFTYDEFIELQNWVTGKGGRALDVTLFDDGISVDSGRLSPNALRLGLLLELIRLRDATVKAANSDAAFSAFELSSGEYHMFSTLMAVGFALEPKAVLLIDEPENNLHPQWQRDLMTSVFSICDTVEMDGHVIVSTHSPLIVGSAPEGTSVLDLSFDEPRLSLVSYGASSDELLLTQFGVGSSRNVVVVDTIQRAISLVETGDFENVEFVTLIPELRRIREALTETDPMVSVIDALLGKEQDV